MPQPFGDWWPDVFELSTGKGGDKLNVLPTLDGWGPFPSMAIASLAIGTAAPLPEPEESGSIIYPFPLFTEA
jgi:hypothetical protein